jgi:predicted NBD/HSP70 family sugar kinase
MIIAVDTGGTKTLLTLFSNRGVALKSHRFATPPDQDEYLHELKKQLTTFLEDVDQTKLRALALASPGIIKNDVIVWGGGNLGWSNVRVKTALRPVLPVGLPVYVENDANLGALGETRMLPAKPRISLYVTISTGIGAGLVTDGALNPYFLSNEAGHMPLEYDGTIKRWEIFASGKAIKKAYGKYASEITSKRAWNHITDRISRGFLALIPVIQPDVIIIGGSIGTHFDKYGNQLQTLLLERMPKEIAVPPIIQALNPEEAVVYGCYHHALNKLAHK